MRNENTIKTSEAGVSKHFINKNNTIISIHNIYIYIYIYIYLYLFISYCLQTAFINIGNHNGN